MNFTQMHEHLRLELLRRIQRGTLSVSLLARQTGFGQSHLSNFLHSRRQLSLEAMDRILAAQHLTAADLLPASDQREICRPTRRAARSRSSPMPRRCLSRSSAPPRRRPCCTCPPGSQVAPRHACLNPRRAWQRFVAVRIPAADALPMEPLVLPEAITLHRPPLQLADALPAQPAQPLRRAARLAPDAALCGFSRQPAGLAARTTSPFPWT